eukprot:scaffold195_cov95-Cyclotella_meneghiniana.AAC.5
MAFYPPHADYTSHQNYPSMGINYPSSGVQDDFEEDWEVSPHSPSFGYGSSITFSQHPIRKDNTYSKKRIKWNKNVKNGRNTVGCAAFQQGCANAIPQGCSIFSSPHQDNNKTPEKKEKSIFERLADVTIANVHKCGVGIGRQCDGKGVNVHALNMMIGGEMCTRCGMNGDYEDGSFVHGKCPQCFRDEGIGRKGYSKPELHYVQDLDPMIQSKDQILDSRDAIAALNDQMMKSRLGVNSARVRPDNQGVTSCENHDHWSQVAVGSPRVTHQFKDENDIYVNEHNKHSRRARRYERSRRGYNKVTIREKTKLVGRCVVKSLSNPIAKLRHGIQSNGAKRILTITRG